MSILKRLRDRLASASTASHDPAHPDSDRMRLSAEIPGSAGVPLWKIDVQVLTEPHGDGERMRLRAHVQSNFGSALKPALGRRKRNDEHRALPSGGGALMSRSQRFGQLAQRAASRALRTPLLRALAEPLLRFDFNTWVEVQASSASLDKGALDLVPAQEQLARMGIKPRKAAKGSKAPVAESWAGEAPGGFAQVSLLQIDKSHLPPSLSRSMGTKPFSMAAAIVNVVEDKK